VTTNDTGDFASIIIDVDSGICAITESDAVVIIQRVRQQRPAERLR
jgi:hypothetical protein